MATVAHCLLFIKLPGVSSSPTALGEMDEDVGRWPWRGSWESFIFQQSHSLLGFSASSAVNVRAAAVLLASQERHLSKCFELM